MKRFLLSIFSLLLLIGCAPRRVQAQFLGYTSPQTVSVAVFSGQTTAAVTPNNNSVTPCVVANGNPCAVPNLGQNMHFLSYTKTGSTTGFDLRIEGSNDGTTFFSISDDAIDTATSSGVLFATGYYPVIRVNLVSIAGGTLTANYSGTSASSSPPVGSYTAGLTYRKATFLNASQGSNGSFTFVPPFTSSAGYIVLFGSGAFPANSTLTVNNVIFNSQIYTPVANFALGGNTTFTIPVSGYPASSITLTYTSGGASANTFSAIYFFLPPGSLGPGPLQSGSSVTTGCPGTALNGTTPIIGNFVSCTPAQFGVNALTEPGAGTSALSNIIDTRGVKNATMKFNCTAGAVTLNVQEYAEDGTTTLALVSPVSGVAAATNADLYIGSESNPAVDTGTLATPPAGVVRFPQRALAFSFTNAGGAGTCTARLFLAY